MASIVRDSILEEINASLEHREPNHPDLTHALQTIRFRGDPEDAYSDYEDWVKDCTEIYPETFRIHHVTSHPMPCGMFLIVTYNV